MNKAETGKVIAMISGVFSNWKPNEMTAPVWFKLLEHIPYPAVTKAVSVYLSQPHEFAPTPGQILQILKDLTATDEDLVTSGEAWEMAISAAGGGNLSAIKNQRVLRAIRGVGFDRIRWADIETELPFVRRDFIRFFDEAKERDETVQSLTPISSGRIDKLLSSIPVKQIQ